MKPWLVRIAVVLLGARLIWMYVVPAWNEISTDFPNYYTPAWALRHERSLADVYDPGWFQRETVRAGITGQAALFDSFPPFSAMVLWPLAKFPPLTAKRIWIVVNLVALAVTVMIVGGALNVPILRVLLIALLAGDALGNNFLFGQFYVVLTLLMVVGIVFLNRRPALAGLCLSLAVVVKLFPIFLVGYFAVQRAWKAVAWTFIGIAVLSLVGVLAMGWAPHRTYLEEAFPRSIRGEIQDPYNVQSNSLQALLRRALVSEPGLNPRPIIDLPALYFFLRAFLVVLILAMTLQASADSPPKLGGVPERTNSSLDKRGRSGSLSRNVAAYGTTPSAPAKVASRHFLSGAATPPNLGGEWGMLISALLLTMPAQASYQQFLLFPGIAAIVHTDIDRRFRIAAAVVFALICSNYMGAMSHWNSGLAMLFGFPRVYLVLALWIGCTYFSSSRSRLLPILAAAAITASVSAFVEIPRWQSHTADQAMMAEPEASGFIETHPEFTEAGLTWLTMRESGFVRRLPDGSELSVDGTPPRDQSSTADGSFMAFSEQVNGRYRILEWSRTTGQTRTLLEGPADYRYPAYHPTGQWLAFATNETGNWDIGSWSRADDRSAILTTSTANDFVPSFSPDGRTIYFASDRRRGYRFTAIYAIPAFSQAIRQR